MIWRSYFVQCVLASISPVAVRLQYVLANVELRCKWFKRCIALGPLLNLDSLCGFRVVAVVPRLYRLGRYFRCGTPCMIIRTKPEAIQNTREGYSANVRGAKFSDVSGSGRRTLECQKGYIVLLLPALPNKGVELLQEKIYQRPFLTVLGN